MNEEGTLADLIKRNKLEEARQLLEQGGQLPGDLRDFDRSQVYAVLAENKAFDIILLLVRTGFIEKDIYEYEKWQGSVFESLFRKAGNSVEEMDFFKTFTASLDNIKDAVQDKTLLELAFVHAVPIELIRLLIDAGCDVHYKNNDEEGFLYKIVQEFSIKENTGVPYLELLIAEGLDPNAANIVGETPLHLALAKHKKQYAELLLQNGADPNQPDKNGETPYYTAVVHQVCGMETYDMLRQYAPPDFSILNKEGGTLLTGAVKMRRSGSANEVLVLQALIADGGDVYQTAPHYGNEKSSLDWICEYNADVLKAVLETGAVDMDHKDHEGNTLLHKVCAYNVNYDQEAARQLYRKVKMLIEHGADVNVANDSDQKPLDFAAQDNLKNKTVELLLKHKD